MGVEDLFAASIETEIFLVYLEIYTRLLLIFVGSDASSLLLILITQFSKTETIVTLFITTCLFACIFLYNFIVFTIFRLITDI